jgi:hypothetical protein
MKTRGIKKTSGKTGNRLTKRGAVSLYIVLFATLLVTVIALGFTRIMMNERDQVSDTDLSQTAYDSAMTGIEDAKLAILTYNECLSRDGAGSVNGLSCSSIISAIQNPNSNTLAAPCDVVPYILGRSYSGSSSDRIETPIATELDQAYTCVRISDQTPNFLSTFDQSTRSRLIPLRTAGATFDRVIISWTRTNPTNLYSSPIQESPGPFGAELLAGAPPILSASIIQSGVNFNLSDFETATSGGNTNRGQMILVPTSGGSNLISAGQVSATNDQQSNKPFAITCGNPASTGSGYSCQATIVLPSPVGGARHSGTAFLLLESVYPLSNRHDFQITLANGSTPVALRGVQVAVDSTGRNADSLRRIEGRIEVVDTAFPYPEWTVELEGESGASFCKNFIVTINNWVSPSGQNVFNHSGC